MWLVWSSQTKADQSDLSLGEHERVNLRMYAVRMVSGKGYLKLGHKSK